MSTHTCVFAPPRLRTALAVEAYKLRRSLALLLAAGWAVAAGVCSSLRVRQGPV